MKLTLLVIFVACFALGCASSDPSYDSVKRDPVARIDVFRDSQRLTKQYREIGLLTDDGRLEEQGEIEAKFINKAKRMGADAIIIYPMINSGGEPRAFGWAHTYLYKAAVVVYE